VARNKKVDAPIVEGKEVSMTIFGWCSTGHHDGCRVEFPGHRCSCKCHNGGEDDFVGEISNE
jgi:hypothetical protein